MKFGIVVSDWNRDITFKLLDGAINILKKHGARENNIITEHVPGSFELPLAAQLIKENTNVDAVICLGCVIQGETPHFTYVCEGVTKGISELTKLSMEIAEKHCNGKLISLLEGGYADIEGGNTFNAISECATNHVATLLSGEIQTETPWFETDSIICRKIPKKTVDPQFPYEFDDYFDLMGRRIKIKNYDHSFHSRYHGIIIVKNTQNIKITYRCIVQ